MSFNASDRMVLAVLADVLIPASEGCLSASAAGVSEEGLDQVLAVRPDLAEKLKEILHRARGRAAAEFLNELKVKDVAAFGVLAEVVPGAYFMNPQVRAAIGYGGQVSRPIDPNPDYPEEGLL